jgi:hypothetical protein
MIINNNFAVCALLLMVIKRDKKTAVYGNEFDEREIIKMFLDKMHETVTKQ